MLPLHLTRNPAAPLKLLLLGAHSDDIEIGCGGTILQLLAERPNVDVEWIVFSSTSEREREARTGAACFLEQCTGMKHVQVHHFRDGYFPYQGAQIKEFFEGLKEQLDPDMIFTHCRDDRHQDHRVINELTWNTWRQHWILEYEVPKYDADLGVPNIFVPIAQDTGALKARYICDTFGSERGKAWMTPDTFLALLRIRGIECAAPDRYAEAFHCRKLVLAA
jgi:LmbE family N-acetylglucosaminyl deacetylase